MNKYIDTHMHLDLSKDHKKLIKLIEENDMTVISMTNHPMVYKKFVKMVYSDNIRIALGFHPEVIEQHSDYLKEMLNLIPEAKYIGEVGLDFSKKTDDEKSYQISSFEKIILACHKYGNKLLSIHSRGSVNEVLSIIPRDFTCSVILHWYSDNEKNLIAAIERGYYFSINLSMMNSNKFKSILNKIPKDRLLIETDYPFINNNEDAYKVQIDNTIYELANYYNTHEENLIKQLKHNFTKLIRETFLN